LNNLIGNAVKFTDKGSVVVESSLHKSDDQSTLILTVKDTGIGISETNKKLIFDAFRQGSEGYNREYEGTGLGLTITKKYVEILNGEINLVSEHGKGSTFTVSLPVIQIESDLPDTTQPNESVIEEDSFKNRVLFVDDDAASRSVLSLFLRKLCEIDVAANGDEAIQLLRDNNYSLILLDISLGKGITGIDLLKMIRADGRTTHLPVMAITAHAMVGDRERFLNEGFNEYISKPFSKDQLLNKIKALLEQKK
jgi:CheY-like chemotaxis protein